MLKKMCQNLKSKKGFTLVELIVIIAVIGIIGGIAVPNFLGIQENSRAKADLATAKSIVKAARTQHSIEDNVANDAIDNLSVDYFDLSVQPQSASTGTFQLFFEDEKYVVYWTDSDGDKHKYIENKEDIESGTITIPTTGVITNPSS